MGVENVLALSTAHMPSSDAYFWSDNQDSVPRIVPRLMPFEYGAVVWVTEEFDNLADWLQPIMRYASHTDCSLIMFDRDVDPGDFERLFKTYEW